ncbi:MAG: tetratricopeptide repeat protein [Alphaproteobacteria bacterium]|nr:tetratricopeptide repeat protein [Alphaproteobacteria bacterium]
MAKNKKTKHDHEQDALIREVWDGVREEKAVRFIQDNWKQGLFGIIIFFIALSGIKLYKANVNRSALKEAQILEQVISRSSLQEKERLNLLQTLSSTGRFGYQGIAVLMHADKALKEGRKEEAIDILKNANIHDAILKNLVALKYAFLISDKVSFDELKKALDGIDDDEIFSHSKKLLLGFKAFEENKKEEAQKYFNALIEDETTPLSIRSTAQEMKNIQ